jgi:hypothetical protein
MSYLQESIVNSIHQERHREAAIERLSGASRLPKRLRDHTMLMPHFTRRTSKPGATIPRPAA